MDSAAGFLLKTKTAGWTGFCDRLHVPPFLLWSVMPEYDRVQRALRAADGLAFDPEGFRRWRDRVRPKDEPAREELVFTAESEADKAEAAFRERVK
jgi:hypothetical protein